MKQALRPLGTDEEDGRPDILGKQDNRWDNTPYWLAL